MLKKKNYKGGLSKEDGGWGEGGRNGKEKGGKGIEQREG